MVTPVKFNDVLNELSSEYLLNLIKVCWCCSYVIEETDRVKCWREGK